MRLTILTSLAISCPSLASLIPVHSIPTAPHVGIPIPLRSSAQLTDDDGVVIPKTLRTQMAKMASKMEQGFRAFETNTGSVHPSDTQRYKKRATGPVPLTNDNDALWHGTISLGTPGVPFTVDFDTGSSDLFLPGINCRASCQGHRIYNTNASSSSQALGRNFSLAYGDGSTVQGDQFRDSVTIANLTATNQTVGAANQYSSGFAIARFPPDGLMGMAFPQISVYGANPVFHTLIAQNKTTSPVFGFKLATNGSELFVGGTNTALFNGTIAENKVTMEGFWQIDLGSVNVNGRPAVTALSAIVDTGTSLVLGDTRSVNQLYSVIPGAKNASSTIGDGFFTVPCNAIPNVSLTFGGNAYAISADTFNLGPVSQGSPDCVGGITAADLGAFWIVGDVFLRNVYTAFNVGNKTVGFANLA